MPTPSATTCAAPARARRRRPWTLAALLAVLVLGAVLRWTLPATVADLRPRPDALEYEEAARSLVAGRGYLLWIANRAYPPRYPPGMSALIAASMRLLGTERGVGIWVVFASALAAIATTFALARRVAGPTAGLVAALLLALSPLHVEASLYVMSDVPATAIVAAIAYGTIVLLDGGASALGCFVLGIACGAAVTLRQPLAPISFATWLAIGLLSPGSPRERVRRMTLVAAGGLVGVAPLLWVNWQLFGSPLRSGYGYWSPRTSFALGRATAEIAGGRPSNFALYGTVLAGGGTLYPWTCSVLLALGTVAGVWRGGASRRLCALAWLVVLPYVLFLLSYSMPSSRLLLPLLPPLVATMALPCAAAAPRALRALGLALAGVTLLLVLGPQRAALGPPISQGGGDVAALQRLARLTERDAVILAYTDPFAFAQLLRDHADRVWVPVRPDEHQLTIGLRKLAPVASDGSDGAWLEPPIVASIARRQLLARVEELCASGRPVYLSAQRAVQVSFFGNLERWLRERWTLTEVAGGEPYVYRVECDRARDGQTS